LKRAKAAAGVERDVALVVSDRAVAPGVWGVWRPIIVLPDRVAHELSYDELEAVLVHELVHVQRRDNLVSNLKMILYSLFWFFPGMWLVDRKLLLERERACDERALETGASPRTYASAILKVSRFSLNRRMAGVSCASAASLTRRLKFIMSDNNRQSAKVSSRLMITATLAAFITTMMAAALMDRTRASAQVLEQGILAVLASENQHRRATD